MPQTLCRLRACVFDHVAYSAETGFTLVEALVAVLIALAVLTPVTAALITTQNHGAGDIARADQVQAAAVGERSMDQELRQAYQLDFPTSTANTGCPVTAGVQGCNDIDFLARLTNTGFAGTDFEVRYDCTVASTTVTGDRSCWRYLCAAQASMPSNPSCTSAGNSVGASATQPLSTKLVIDDLVNGSSIDPVFSLCYPSATGTGCGASTATRATSATVTIKTRSTPNQATGNGGDPAIVVLTDGVYFPNLDYGQ